MLWRRSLQMLAIGWFEWRVYVADLVFPVVTQLGTDGKGVIGIFHTQEASKGHKVISSNRKYLPQVR